MPTCRDCGSEKVGWDKTKAGHHYLRDFGQPHHNTCPAKNGQIAAKKKAKENGASPVLVAVVGALENLGIKQAEARRQVQTALDADPALKDDEDALLLAAVKGGNDGIG